MRRLPYVLLAILILIPVIGCAAPNLPVPATQEEPRFAEIEARLSQLEKQIVDIQFELGIGIEDYPVGSREWWALQGTSGKVEQLEKRIAELEKKLGVSQENWGWSQ